jgi:hypothetical protein
MLQVSKIVVRGGWVLQCFVRSFRGFGLLGHCWGLAKFIKPRNQQGRHRTPTTQMTDPLVGTPASAHSVPPEPNAIFCMVFCFTKAIGLYGLIVAVNPMD